MHKLQPIGSYGKISDAPNELIRTASIRSNPNLGHRKKASTEILKSPHRIFLTQDETVNEFFEETTMHTAKNQRYEVQEKGYKTLQDKRVKNLLGKLDATMNKLTKAWDSCEKTFSRTPTASYYLRGKTAATFALTETTGIDRSTMLSQSKSSNAQHFLSMTMSDFFNPEVTAKIHKVVESLDLDPQSNKIRDGLWDKINEGRDYYNVLKDEVRKKKDYLKQLKEKDELCDVLADNTSLENRIVELEQEIQKARSDIESADMQTEVLHSMIYQRKEDRDLYRKRFILKYLPYVQTSKEVEKNIDNIHALEKMLQNFMCEMTEIASSSKDNQKLKKKLKRFQKEKIDKEARFEKNLNVEKAFQRKRKQFIIKTKKEIEVEREIEKEREELAEKQKLAGLFEMRNDFENKFDLLSTVSKQYHDKEEYVNHLDSLRENNEDLENRLKNLMEEINLKRKIDLPTLQAELDELKTTKDPNNGFFEQSKLKKELEEKRKRNEDMERIFTNKQNLLTNMVRGVMTVFNNVTVVKDYLNLEKLDEIKLKQDNLGDVLLFCGEVLEILSKNQAEPDEIKSQPLSFMSISDA